MLLAVLVSLALAAAAPFIGELRRSVALALPGQYVWIVNGTVGLVGLAVLVSAVRRIRERRRARFSLMGGAVVIAVVFTRMTGSSDPAVAAVEHFHFVQYGFITWLFYRAWRKRGDAGSLVLPAAAAFVFGIAEEWWQWFLPARVGELNDVLLNTVAITCGLMVSTALAPLAARGASPAAFDRRCIPPDCVAPSSNTPGILGRRALSAGRFAGLGATRDLHHGLPGPMVRESAGPGIRGGASRGVRDSVLGAAVAILALAAFAWTVHVGYLIADPSIGEFRSRYAAAALLSLSAERASRWAMDPPLERRTLTREDQYRSEGEAHVRARNDAWERGDVARAWGENLILEKYFEAVLDTPSHISRTGHRWHIDHRADAGRRVAALGTTPPFISSAAVDTRWQLGR